MNLVPVLKPAGGTVHLLDRDKGFGPSLCGEEPKGKFLKPAYWNVLKYPVPNSVLKTRRYCEKCMKLAPDFKPEFN